jgi:BirA family biotin operon repressor/biotin-[acetyl-CoA-carboxylase] ligase
VFELVDRLTSHDVAVTDGTGFKTGGAVASDVNETRRAILDAVEEGPASGPELAGDLGVSRTAVWKAVEALREEGFGIDAGEDGYVLTAVPEYGAGAVEYRLGPDFAVEYHDEIPSTNARAREIAREGGFAPGDGPGVVVLAEEQTGGRGRLDREWTSPPGGVWMSVLLRPDLPPARAPLVTLAAAVATARAVDDAAVEAGGDGPTVGLKWPNDVLAADRGEERKLAGILTEMEGETDEVSWVVVGIGVNANVDAGDLPDGATSLRALAGDVDRGRFVADVLGAFDTLRAAPGEILAAWRDRSLTLGRRVRIEKGDGEAVIGEAVGVEPPGALLVNAGTGTVRVHAGDCEHLRREDADGPRGGT